MNKKLGPVNSLLNIAYGPHPLHRMDIYFPKGYDTLSPVLFYIHGGGFVGGTKDEVKMEAGLFVKNGFVTVVPDYRLVNNTGMEQSKPVHLASEVKILDQVADLNIAVLCYEKIAQEFGAGVSKLFMAGHSAGGTLAMLLVQGSKKGKMLASANLAGLTSFAIPNKYYQTPPIEEPHWHNMKEYFYRLSGSEFSKINENAIKAISVDCVFHGSGGKPNISIMPKSNDTDIGVKPFLNTIESARHFHHLLKHKGIPSAFSLMNTDHDFSKHPNDWTIAIDAVVLFFNKI